MDVADATCLQAHVDSILLVESHREGLLQVRQRLLVRVETRRALGRRAQRDACLSGHRGALLAFGRGLVRLEIVVGQHAGQLLVAQAARSSARQQRASLVARACDSVA